MRCLRSSTHLQVINSCPRDIPDVVQQWLVHALECPEGGHHHRGNNGQSPQDLDGLMPEIREKWRKMVKETKEELPSSSKPY